MHWTSRSVSGLLAAIALSLLTATSALAELRFANHFGDHMVLQRQQPVMVRGYAGAGAEVSVAFAGQTKTTTADAKGAWTVTLDAMDANATGAELNVESAGKSVALKDVVVGDVIVVAQQSAIDNVLGDEAASVKPAGVLRAIIIDTKVSLKPLDELNPKATTGWASVTPASAKKLSPTAYYFGSDLAKEAGVPIGVIDIHMNQFFAIGWMSEQAISDAVKLFPNDKELDWLPQWIHKQYTERESGEAQKFLDKYYEGMLKKARGRTPEKPSLGLHPAENPLFASGGFNAVIHPLRNHSVKAILLQLGTDYPFIAYRKIAEEGKAQMIPELNRAWSQNYKIIKHGYRVTPATLPRVPADWRRTFGNKALPIGLISPPGSDLDAYAGHNREIREMHRRMADGDPNMGVIVPGPGNIPFSGQPTDKKTIAKRALHWVLGTVYNKEDVVATGPIFDRVEARLSKGTIYFKEGTAEGLKADGDALNYFEAAGPGGDFYPAKAEIDGNTIKITCPEAGQIVFVRYGWAKRPQQGLVNAAGLPAAPFNSDDRWEFAWIIPASAPELPEEYSLTADKWGDNNLAVINGEIDNLATGDSEMIPRRPGPIGIFTAPFGPNIYVISTDKGTPAHGVLLPGDVIYGANGKVFEGDQYRQLSAAITYSETEPAEGKLVLKVRRGSKLIDVELELEVMGTFSATTPYYCPKSEKIIEKAGDWSYSKFRPSKGPAVNQTGFLNTDLLFHLGSGDPRLQGLTRRAVYQMISRINLNNKPTQLKPTNNWNNGYTSMILGEYYHATGDRNVLPYLKHVGDWAVIGQIKPPGDKPVTWETAKTEQQLGGWRHKYHPNNADRMDSGYGLMPHAGMTAIMGWLFSKEAGLKIDEVALARGLMHYHKQRAEHAYVLYGYAEVRRPGPPALNTDAEEAGKLSSMNGKLGAAAALFNLVDDQRTVEMCGRHCVFAFNNTRHGHGGMYFNNFWTPIGAFAAGESGFKHFMKNQTWWRELYRKQNGSFKQVGRGGIGVAYALHYAAPKKRLRILGAPRTAFGTACPDYLKPAVAAHFNRDYAEALRLATTYARNNVIPGEDRPLFDHFVESVRILIASIEHDLEYVEKCIKNGDYDYAAVELTQLKGVVSPDNARLKAIIEKLESPEVTRAMRDLSRQRAAEGPPRRRPKVTPAHKAGDWTTLTPKRGAAKPTIWKMKLVEAKSQSPEGWTKPDFDDAKWDDATFPLSWAMYHTALYRGSFEIKNKADIEALRVRGRFFQQANVVVYINGKVVAKVDNIGRGVSDTYAPLTDYALEVLKEGTNTIAVSSRHKRRWGALRGTFTTAAGYSVALDAQIKK